MDRWVDKFERAGLVGRLSLLTGGAVRLAATAAETALDRAASIAVEAREAFRKELDPNVTDAKVLEETDERLPPPAR